MTGDSPGNRNVSKYILSASSIRVSSKLNDLKFNKCLEFKIANDKSVNKAINFEFKAIRPIITATQGHTEFNSQQRLATNLTNFHLPVRQSVGVVYIGTKDSDRRNKLQHHQFCMHLSIL